MVIYSFLNYSFFILKAKMLHLPQLICIWFILFISKIVFKSIKLMQLVILTSSRVT